MENMTHSIVPTPDKITKLGIARTFQNIRLFKSQTVFENILIARASENEPVTVFYRHLPSEWKRRSENA